jgi:hypothetical protein
MVRSGVSQGAEHAIQLHGLVSFVGKQKLHRIDCDGLGMIQIRAAIYEPSEGYSRASCAEYKFAGGDSRDSARQGDVDKALVG